MISSFKGQKICIIPNFKKKKMINWITQNWESISLAFVTASQAVKAIILIFKKKQPK